jgi:nucleoside phosphorylase
LSGKCDFEVGRLISVTEALTEPDQKRKAGKNFLAIAVDMESASLAAACQEKGLPWAIVRVILDPLSVKVPDPSEFLDRDKRISKRRVVSYVAKNPQAIWELPRLASHAKRARQRIAEVMPDLVEALSTTEISL